MTALLIAVLLPFGLIVGLAGWGGLLLGGRDARHDIGLRAAAGLCLYLVLAGLAEAFGVASAGAILVFLADGVALGARALARGRRLPAAWPPTTPAERVALVAVAAAGLALIVNAADWTFINTDDAQGYLVHVARILQTGSMGGDPFDYRRFEGGLGGGNSVDALGGVLGDVARLRVVDIGGGLLILAALVRADLAERGGSARALAAGLAAAVALVAFAPSVNMTPEIVGMALVYATLRLCRLLVAEEDGPRWRRAGLIALFAAGLAALKTPFVLPAAAFAAAAYATLALAGRRRAVALEAALAGVVALVLLGPWMLVSWRQAGTPFFPLLGVGRLSPLEVTGHPSTADFVKGAGRTALLLALPVWLAVSGLRRRRDRSETFMAVAAGLAAALLLLAQTHYTVSGYRYGYAGAAGLFLGCLAYGIAEPRTRAAKLVMLLGAPLLLLDVALYPLLAPGYGADTYHGGWLYRALAGVPPTDPAAERARTRALQAVLPRGATLLARIDRPYELDFRRNRVLVMDWPGLIGPGAGPPRSADPGLWRRYLAEAGVDAVAWSYRDEAGMPAATLRPLIARSDSAFLREQLGRTVAVQAALEALRRTSPVIADDGATALFLLAPSCAATLPGIATTAARDCGRPRAR